MSYPTTEKGHRVADSPRSDAEARQSLLGSQPVLEPIDHRIFEVGPDGPRLIASRCRSCTTLSFPAQTSCPRCTSADVEGQLLSTRGTLWSWTVQTVRPKSPPYAGIDDQSSFVPFGVGYVELEDELRIESRLTVADPAQLRIGMDMKLVVEPFDRVAGPSVLVYAFSPIDEDAA